MAKRLLVCILIVLMINNFFCSNISLAEEPSLGDTAWKLVVEGIEDILGTVVGIFAIIPKLVVLPLAFVMQSLMTAIAYSQGTADADGNISTTGFFDFEAWYLSPFDIIFNKVALVDVNVFNIPSTEGAIKNIRESIAGWYYVMRNLAAIILLCVLIYVGIRMAISTVASDKAAYKKMLVDWACSLALIFLLQYIIVFTFNVNSAFVKSLADINDQTGVEDAIIKLYLSAIKTDLDSIAATVAICMLTFQTFALLVSYIQRMLKVSFLVIISPLITLTYSIDKMGDGKAQALNTWLKEFVFTVLLQPFHCIIYMAFIGVALELLGNVLLPEYDNNNISSVVLVILCIHFTKEAEKLLGKIFNFSGNVSGASLATGLVAATAVAKNAGKIGTGAKSVVNGAKNLKGSIKTARIELATLGGIMAGKSAEEARTKATEKVETKDREWDGRVNKAKETINGKVSDVKKAIAGTAVAGTLIEAKKKASEQHKSKAKDRAIDKAEEKLISQGAARSEARALAERMVNEKEKKKKQRIENLKTAKGFIKDSKTYAQIKKDVIPAMVAVGIGTFAAAGSYGAGGDIMQSFAYGGSAYKASREFQKKSSKRLAEENAGYAYGAGARSIEDVKAYTESLMSRSDEFEKASEEIDKIFDQIKAALASDLSSQDAKTLKSRIKNVVDNTLLENPSASNTNIAEKIAGDEKISDIIKRTGTTMESFKASSALGNMISFQRDSKAYTNVKSVNSWGLSTDAMIDDTIKQFDSQQLTSDSNIATTMRENILEERVAATEEQMEQLSIEDRERMKTQLKEDYDRAVAENDTEAQKIIAESLEAAYKADSKEEQTIIATKQAELESKYQLEIETERQALKDAIERLERAQAAMPNKKGRTEIGKAKDRMQQDLRNTVKKLEQQRDREIQQIGANMAAEQQRWGNIARSL